MKTTVNFVGSLFISVIFASNASSDTAKVSHDCKEIWRAPFCYIDEDKRETYNIAEVRSHQFIETWTAKRKGSLYIRAHVANQRPGISQAPFTPIVTLAFHDEEGKKAGEVKLHFNVPASRKNEWHETYIAGGTNLWDRSSSIVASAAESKTDRPPEGSWTFTIGISGDFP